MMREREDKNEVRHRYFTICLECRKRYESDSLDDVPESCCGYVLVVNDRKRLYSRYKKDLKYDK